MPKVRKPAPRPTKPTATEKMIAECVKKAQARKKSGQADREWREQYAASLKVEKAAAGLSQTPFDGHTNKKKV